MDKSKYLEMKKKEYRAAMDIIFREEAGEDVNDSLYEKALEVVALVPHGVTKDSLDKKKYEPNKVRKITELAQETVLSQNLPHLLNYYLSGKEKRSPEINDALSVALKIFEKNHDIFYKIAESVTNKSQTDISEKSVMITALMNDIEFISNNIQKLRKNHIPTERWLDLVNEKALEKALKEAAANANKTDKNDKEKSKTTENKTSGNNFKITVEMREKLNSYGFSDEVINGLKYEEIISILSDKSFENIEITKPKEENKTPTPLNFTEAEERNNANEQTNQNIEMAEWIKRKLEWYEGNHEDLIDYEVVRKDREFEIRFNGATVHYKDKDNVSISQNAGFSVYAKILQEPDNKNRPVAFPENASEHLTTMLATAAILNNSSELQGFVPQKFKFELLKDQLSDEQYKIIQDFMKVKYHTGQEQEQLIEPENVKLHTEVKNISNGSDVYSEETHDKNEEIRNDSEEIHDDSTAQKTAVEENNVEPKENSVEPSVEPEEKAVEPTVEPKENPVESEGNTVRPEAEVAVADETLIDKEEIIKKYTIIRSDEDEVLLSNADDKVYHCSYSVNSDGKIATLNVSHDIKNTPNPDEKMREEFKIAIADFLEREKQEKSENIEQAESEQIDDAKAPELETPAENTDVADFVMMEAPEPITYQTTDKNGNNYEVSRDDNGAINLVRNGILNSQHQYSIDAEGNLDVKTSEQHDAIVISNETAESLIRNFLIEEAITNQVAHAKQTGEKIPNEFLIKEGLRDSANAIEVLTEVARKIGNDENAEMLGKMAAALERINKKSKPKTVFNKLSSSVKGFMRKIRSGEYE